MGNIPFITDFVLIQCEACDTAVPPMHRTGSTTTTTHIAIAHLVCERHTHGLQCEAANCAAPDLALDDALIAYMERPIGTKACHDDRAWWFDSTHETFIPNGRHHAIEESALG